MIIDNFYGALYTQPVLLKSINPPGEIKYKGYVRKLFCSIRGHAIEDVKFDKPEEHCADTATHFVVMTGNGKVVYSSLISHKKDYTTSRQ